MFWTQTVAEFVLDGGSSELLVEVCRCMDQLDGLAAAVAADGRMVAGSTGQPVVHPAVGEARLQQAVLHRLLAALDLPADDEGSPSVPSTSTLRARKAAKARWAGHNATRAVRESL